MEEKKPDDVVEMNPVTEAAREIVSVVKHIVDRPEAVRVEVHSGRLRTTVELYTAPEDVGQVLGKNGHLTSSIRSLLSALAGKHRVMINFDFVTEKESKARRVR